MKQNFICSLPVVILMHGWNLFLGKNEDWVQQWIPILTAQDPAGRVINSSNFFPRYKDFSMSMVIAKKGMDSRNARGQKHCSNWLQ